MSMGAILDLLNAPLYEGSRFLGWAAAAFVLLPLLLLCLRVRRKKCTHAKKPPRTSAPTSQPKEGSTPRAIEVANLQGLGMREEQQDAFGMSALAEYEAKGLLAVLADGMGGLAMGAEIAQSIVSQALSGWQGGMEPNPEKEVLRLSVINEEVHAQYGGQGGATAVLAYLCGGRLWFFCAGDSDLLLLRHKKLYALNARHEYQNELFADALYGRVSVEAALSDLQGAALSQYIGNRTVVFDYTKKPFLLECGDTLMLCSDGVSDTLSLGTIAACMALPAPACCQALERCIQDAGLINQDNYTAIVLQYNTEIGGKNYGDDA